MSKQHKPNRRDAIKVFSTAIAATAALSKAPRIWPGRGPLSGSASAAGEKQRFIIVLTLNGGASIIDSFMAASETEVGANAGALNCFPDSQIAKHGPFSAVNLNTTIAALGALRVITNQSQLLEAQIGNTAGNRLRDNLAVMTLECTSVNHAVAAARSMTGNDAWHGRMLQEAIAAQYGTKQAIPNLSMAVGSYATQGIDPNLPGYARSVQVADPLTFPLGLHTTAGLSGLPADALIEVARKARDEGLEPTTNFLKAFRDNKYVKAWISNRDVTRREFERLDLVNKLFYADPGNSGLSGAAESAMLRDTFPNYMLDYLDAQAITAYLAITRNLSSAVTFGPNTSTVVGPGGVSDILSPPIAFDFSHTDNRGVQAMMWSRVLNTAVKIADLLAKKPMNDGSGDSFFDRTMIYLATDFGRTKLRPNGASSFGSGHDLNNGAVVISPMANPGIFGGVDKATMMTYGFDGATGAPMPNKKNSEKELYTALLNIMRVDTGNDKLPNMSSVVKGA